MNVVTFGKDILRVPFEPRREPNIPYLVENAELRYIREYERLSGYELCMEVSEFDSMNWQYPKETKSILLWNTGRIGDQLWMTAIVRKIKTLFPFVEIDVIANGGGAEIWQKNKDIRSIKHEPTTLSFIQHYTDLIFFDETIASDKTNKNCYAILFESLNLPYEPSDCIPNFRVTRRDEHVAYNTLVPPDETGRIQNIGNHFMVGLHTAVDSRNLHVTQVMALIRGLSRFAPGNLIFGISSGQSGAMLQEKILEMEIPEYISCHDKVNIASLAGLMNHAACVIAPDSMLVHLAASQGVACVAIMSTCSPESRVSTYPLCEPVWKSEVCEHAPCFWKHDKLYQNHAEQIEYAPCYQPNLSQCRVAVNVRPNDVLAAVNRVTKKRMEFDSYTRKVFPVE